MEKYDEEPKICKRKLSTLMDEETRITDSQKIPAAWDNHSPNSKFLIAIVGGGISGLGAALALQRKGFRVTVFERDALFEDRRQGYGLTLTNNPKGPLADLDLLDECIATDCPSNAHWVFTPQGNILGYYGRSFKSKTPVNDTDSSAITGAESFVSNCTTGRPQDLPLEGRANLRIPRQNLRKMMLKRLKPDTVRWGMKLLDYTENSDEVQAIFQSCNPPHPPSSLSDAVSEVTPSTISVFNNSTSNVEEITADILVGADGVRSIVRQLRSKKIGALGNNKLIHESAPLHYVGVSVILGITTATHPLINQQGFYCLDGTNRLFTMPFEEENTKIFSAEDAFAHSGVDKPLDGMANESVSEEKSTSETGANVETSSKNIGATKLTMWQLSFSDFTEEEGAQLKTAGPDALLAEALKRCKGWFEPVCDMINCTPKKEVWGTGLYDRDPMPLRSKDQGSRVTVMGDACHPMSMFKGQGANQALHDGPLLASWLDCGTGPNAKKCVKVRKSNLNENKIVDTELNSRNLYTRLRCFEREMVARSAPKVAGSREAAEALHSPAVLTDNFGVEGVKAEMSATLIKKLTELRIGAHLSHDLEAKLKSVIDEVLPQM